MDLVKYLGHLRIYIHPIAIKPLRTVRSLHIKSAIDLPGNCRYINILVAIHSIAGDALVKLYKILIEPVVYTDCGSKVE